jgi:hypothetical protein
MLYSSTVRHLHLQERQRQAVDRSGVDRPGRTGQVIRLPGKLCSVARINSQEVGTPGLQGCSAGRRAAIILELS